jgi:hypothetical protein
MKKVDQSITAAVAAAVHSVMLDVLTRRLALPLAVDLVTRAALDAALGDERRERPRRRYDATAALAQMSALEGRGKRRSAASILAKRMARNPDDPAEVEIIAQHLRRLRRKETRACSVRAKKEA